MKKFSLLGVCLLGAFALSAQTDVVKEVERTLKGSNPDYAAAAQAIKPALTDEATKNDALAWKLAGQAGEGIYDTYYKKAMLGQELSADEKKLAGHGLLDCYVDYITAIPLDFTINKKGEKKKGKLTKDMVKSLVNNYQQLKNAGVYCFEAQDFMGAYDIWDMYVNIPSNPVVEGAIKADPDTVVGQMMYYQMLSALSANENEKALSRFQPIENSGFQNIDVYVYAIEAARRLNDTVAMTDIAKKGYAKYGTQNIQFVGNLINDLLNRGDYAGCYDLVNKALEATPDSNTAIKCQLYDILGVVSEQQENFDKALEAFDKAIAYDPNSAKSYYDKGRVIYNKAVKLDEQLDADENARVAQVNPLLLDAAKFFEKAYELDADNLSNIPGILYRLYYRLGAGYETQMENWKNR